MRFERIVLSRVGPFEALDLPFPEGSDPGKADVHLLVGPNGTGKTTLLQALGQLVTANDLGLVRRLWGQDSEVGVTYTYAPDRRPGTGRITAEGTRPDTRTLVPGLAHSGPVGQLNLARATDLTSATVHLGEGASALVFAYGNERHGTTVGSHLAVQEPTDNPIADAVAFTRPAGLRPFVEWVASVRATESLLRGQGDLGAAELRSAGLSRLEDALGRVFGAKVALELQAVPLAVRVRLGGAPPCSVDVLPDGVRSLLGWLGDLLMRLHRIPWPDGRTGVDQPFVLLLDEVEAHLHPTWQRHLFPVVERLFPAAQIIASTHSPFVVSSASDAWVHRLGVVDGRARHLGSDRAPRGVSYTEILRDLMSVPSEFDVESERHLDALHRARDGVLTGDPTARAQFDAEVEWLRGKSAELGTIATLEQAALQRRRAP